MRFFVFILSSCLIWSKLSASDGTAAEVVTLNIASKLPFVDRAQFADRGVISYAVPAQLDDGIPVADAREHGDLAQHMR